MGHIYTDTISNGGGASNGSLGERRTTAAPTFSRPAPHPDGFGGARDAAIIDEYMDEETMGTGTVLVQATARTEYLLKRAGVTRQKRHAWYSVRVVTDRFQRLQLAPEEPAPVLALPAPRTVARSPLAALNRRMICAYNSAQRTWTDYKVSRHPLALSTYLFHLRRCERLQSAIRRTAGVP